MSSANFDMLMEINDILEEYEAKKLTPISLRQLYYQLVSRGIIANQDSEYKKIGRLLTEGRMAGYVDWDLIEDRLREPHRPWYTYGPAGAIETVLYQYRLDRQEDQYYNLLVVIEKDAISNVMKPITGEYGVRLLVNRGYGSSSAMYGLAKMFEEDGRPAKILYMGDHDPSGLDMIRDVRERLWTFGVEVDVEAIALTWDQVQDYRPIPNPAKFKDPRAGDYVAKYGKTSWEVDALDPLVSRQVLRDAIVRNMDMDIYRAVLAQEKEDMETLREIAEGLE